MPEKSISQKFLPYPRNFWMAISATKFLAYISFIIFPYMTWIVLKCRIYVFWNIYAYMRVFFMRDFPRELSFLRHMVNEVYPRNFVADMLIQKFLRYGRNFCDIDFSGMPHYDVNWRSGYVKSTNNGLFALFWPIYVIMRHSWKIDIAEISAIS